MKTIRPEELERDFGSYIRAAHNGDYVRVAGRDGTCVVVISDIHWQMLNQAFNLCVEHPEWMGE